MYAIEATDLKKRFKGVQAVDGISISVREGEVVGLLGPNGAGKTTTIMMLLGAIEPDEGKVSLLGHPLPSERTQALLQTNFTAAYIGFPNKMKIREILDVHARLYGVPRRRSKEVAELFSLDGLLDRFATSLSSGQKTLVGLAKAMLNRPKLLILDEPTASLDPQVAATVREILFERQLEERFTLLITSHNMNDVDRLCGRVIFVRSGRIVADGAPSEIQTRFGTSDLE
ncbi:MAG: ABC transporter ATP-binding protein [Acidimicrobiia bacterium]